MRRAGCHEASWSRFNRATRMWARMPLTGRSDDSGQGAEELVSGVTARAKIWFHCKRLSRSAVAGPEPARLSVGAGILR